MYCRLPANLVNSIYNIKKSIFALRTSIPNRIVSIKSMSPGPHLYFNSFIVVDYVVCQLTDVAYIYWTVHNLIVENKRPTWCHLLFLFNFLCAQHVSDINISIIRSLRLFCWITTLVVCSWFDVCWCFGVVGLEWYPLCRLQPATRIPTEQLQAPGDGYINVRNMLSA